jgi:hypothetical protein
MWNSYETFPDAQQTLSEVMQSTLKYKTKDNNIIDIKKLLPTYFLLWPLYNFENEEKVSDT